MVVPVYDPFKHRALLRNPLECLIGLFFFAVGAVTQYHLYRILFICCHVKLLVTGMFVYCRPNARSPQGCEIYLTPSDFYLLSRSIIQTINSHFKYGQGLFLDTVDSDNLA